VLAEEIVKPGVEAVTMFRNVQRRVRAVIKQEPYLGFNALGDVYLAGLASDPPKVMLPPAPPAPAPSEAAEAWQLVQNTQSVAALEAFVRRFGDTFQGDLAKVRLSELKQAEASRPAEAAKKKADDEARAKAEAERQQLALLQQEEERKRAEEAGKAQVAIGKPPDVKPPLPTRGPFDGQWSIARRCTTPGSSPIAYEEVLTIRQTLPTTATGTLLGKSIIVAGRRTRDDGAPSNLGEGAISGNRSRSTGRCELQTLVQVIMVSGINLSPENSMVPRRSEAV
jgi:hypothetical protein